jgi:hypothetical protein
MTNISFEKITQHLERDIRNQVVIDQLKRLTWKDRAMFYWEINGRRISIWFCIWLWVVCFMSIGIHHALSAECPTPGEKCKVIFLTEQEEKMLMGQNGILDTAAQARALDLGQFAVYLKTRINGAPQGEVKEIEKPVDKK